ncbi:MAG: hypothetical protein MJ252_09810, partial [archaeon]|nr:hypothetical protein [archaeon]
NVSSPYIEQPYIYILNINREIINDMLLNTIIGQSENKTEEQIKNLIEDYRFFFADETVNLMVLYGFNIQNEYLKNLLDKFINGYNKRVSTTVFVALFLIILMKGVCVYYMIRMMKSTDVELENIFSLMPYPLAVDDKNIKQILSA